MSQAAEPSTSEMQGGAADIRSIIAAIATISVVGMGLGLSGPLLSLLMERDGISSSVIGANTAVAGLAAIVATPFVTDLARQFGVVKTIATAIVLSALTLVALYVTEPIPTWFILRFMLSLFMSVLFVLSEFWINYSANEKTRGFVLGIYGTVLSIGFATGPAIVSFVGIDGFLPFAIGAIIILSALVPPLLARKGQPVIERSGKTPSLLPYLFVVPLATAAGFVFGAAEQSQLSLLPVYGTSTGMSAADAALLLTVLGVGNVVFQLPLGIWSDRVSDRRHILLCCGVAGIAGAILLPIVSHSIWLTYLIIFLWGGVIGGLYTVGLAHLGSRLTGADLAQANAAFVLCYATGMTIGPQLVGVSMDVFGQYGFSIGLGTVFIAYLALYCWRVLFSTR
ncbi:MAG: MFS transporter [Rhizobiaceae bacterium]|nr:MFS transporter [Rhizobiaceae bacterium]